MKTYWKFLTLIWSIIKYFCKNVSWLVLIFNYSYVINHSYRCLNSNVIVFYDDFWTGSYYLCKSLKFNYSNRTKWREIQETKLFFSTNNYFLINKEVQEIDTLSYLTITKKSHDWLHLYYLIIFHRSWHLKFILNKYCS